MVGRSLAAVQQQVSTRAARAWKAVREAASFIESGAFAVGSRSSSGLMMLMVCSRTGCCCGCASGLCREGCRHMQMQDPVGADLLRLCMLHNTVLCAALCATAEPSGTSGVVTQLACSEQGACTWIW